MEEGADKRLFGSFQRLDTGMGNLGGLVVLEHVVQVLQHVHDSSLVLVVPELARMHSLIVFLNRSPVVRIGMADCRQTPCSSCCLPLWYELGSRSHVCMVASVWPFGSTAIMEERSETLCTQCRPQDPVGRSPKPV